MTHLSTIRPFHRLLLAAALTCALAGAARASEQALTLDGTAPGRTFDGVGAVSGGGGTSVLLKDYPEPERSQILDILFKPKFAASMQTLYVEIGSDGNSTQGSEPTHMRSPTDHNARRGYEWWLMSEARKRSPALTLDACAWGAPGWVGNGNFWSQDMCDYYVSWVRDLKATYGLTLDAIGCRNERGSNFDWVKQFRKTLDQNGLASLPIHAFDDPGNERMWSWIPSLEKDPALNAAVGIVGNHCLTQAPEPAAVRETLRKLHKTVWNTEDHVYNADGAFYPDAYSCALGAVHRFNINYIDHDATKIVNWYLVGSTYGIEPYADQPPAMFANSPWSGHYALKPIIWAYAHYGQFTQVGWHYVDSGCTHLAGGGSVVTMRAATGRDYSVIAETAGAKVPQTVRFAVEGGLSRKALCVWLTTRSSDFVRQSDVTPDATGVFTITLQPDAIYSLSTTRGQQKGGFTNVPAEKPFPFPYRDNFDEYSEPSRFGYLPHYTADIVGVFEVVDRPDGRGKCLRQVVNRKVTSWAPEWKPYTILGDATWTDYQVSADISFDDGGWAGVMGRVCQTGNGWDNDANGYYARLDADGACSIVLASDQIKGTRDRALTTGRISGWKSGGWHTVMLRFEGAKITMLVDGAAVLSAVDHTYPHGMAGLITGGDHDTRYTALFDNLTINRVNGGAVRPTVFSQDHAPIYAPSANDSAD